MSKIAAIFPGQASQYVGMAKVLLDEFPWTRILYEEASDSIGVDLKALCLEGPPEKLQLTENQQPSILVTSSAWFEVLKRNLDFQPFAGAGHSLGEYSALRSAGALSLPDATRLVKNRGRLMQEAVPVGTGKMAAVIGLDDQKVLELCSLASEGNSSSVVAANFNAPNQVVIAGHAEAVERAEKLASDPSRPDFKARKVIPLNVSAPFHSPLMTPVAKKFVPYLEGVTWQCLSSPIVSNLDAEMRSEGQWVDLLRDQIDHPVLWTACTRTLEQHGAQVFVELGPNKVLSALVKRIVKDAAVYSVDSVDELMKIERAFKEDFNAGK